MTDVVRESKLGLMQCTPNGIFAYYLLKRYNWLTAYLVYKHATYESKKNLGQL